MDEWRCHFGAQRPKRSNALEKHTLSEAIPRRPNIRVVGDREVEPGHCADWALAGALSGRALGRGGCWSQAPPVEGSTSAVFGFGGVQSVGMERVY